MIKKDILQTFKECGIQPSVQRIAIMNYLWQVTSHPTAEEVYAALSPEMPTLSKTTVYNTLRLLAENGAALMLTIDDKKVRFDGDVRPHAHFLCRGCDRVFDAPLHEKALWMSVPESITHFDVEEIHYYYRGLCDECKAMLNKN